MTDSREVVEIVYCRTCNYALSHCSRTRCPECGTPFSPDDAGSYLARPVGPVPTPVTVLASWIAGVAVLGAAAAGLIARKAFGLEAGAWVTGAVTGAIIAVALAAAFRCFGKVRSRAFHALRRLDTRSWD